MQKTWELAELVAFMKSNRVTRVKLGGLEVDLAPTAFAEIEAGPVADSKPDPMPTDHDLLHWSTPLMDRLEDGNGQA